MNEWCFRSRFCTVKAILGWRQHGRMRTKAYHTEVISVQILFFIYPLKLLDKEHEHIKHAQWITRHFARRLFHLFFVIFCFCVIWWSQESTISIKEKRHKSFPWDYNYYSFFCVVCRWFDIMESWVIKCSIPSTKLQSCQNVARYIHCLLHWPLIS